MPRRWKMALLSAVLSVGGAGCEQHRAAPDGTSSSSSTSAPTTAAASAAAGPSAAPSASVQVMDAARCPPDMVRVTPPPADAGPLRPYCVDRYEGMLVDADSGQRISPYYAPQRRAARLAAKIWEQKRFQMGGPAAQQVPLPTLPPWELQRDFTPRARSRAAVVPNGHVTGELAEQACGAAGKRLCTLREWRTACGGQEQRLFPYGEKFVAGACNVFREAHPAMELHDDPSIGHSDPRLNRVMVHGRPLLRKTGASPRCVSRWGDDAIYDMVGNLDEWLDDPDGTFAGGFYGRATREGCDWHATAHPFSYGDYSTGVRCCTDLPAAPN